MPQLKKSTNNAYLNNGIYDQLIKIKDCEKGLKSVPSYETYIEISSNTKKMPGAKPKQAKKLMTIKFMKNVIVTMQSASLDRCGFHTTRPRKGLHSQFEMLEHNYHAFLVLFEFYLNIPIERIRCHWTKKWKWATKGRPRFEIASKTMKNFQH